jgi:hypothetical protein
MTTPIFAPGFRLSFIDVAVLVMGTIGTIALWSMTWWWGFVVGFVLAHFFLFCNVFRIARNLELMWAAVFLALAGATIVAEVPGWIATTIMSLMVTVAVVAAEIRKPSYHGIAWNRINPALPAWWEDHFGPSTPKSE